MREQHGGAATGGFRWELIPIKTMGAHPHYRFGTRHSSRSTR